MTMYSSCDTFRWVSPFGYLRIKANLPAPRSFSQAITSFVAYHRQGIHHMLLVTRPYNFDVSEVSQLQKHLHLFQGLMSGLSPDALCRNVNTPQLQPFLVAIKNIRGNRLSTTALSIALSQSITKQPDASSSRFVIETLFNQLYSIIGGG